MRVGHGNVLGLSPDGSKVLALAITPSELVVYPTGTGERTVLSKGPIETYLPLGAWFPDGERILTCGSEKGRGPRCYEQRVDGLPKAVTPEGLVGAALSVNGRHLLGQDSNRTWQVVDLTSGALRAAAGLQPTDVVAGWSNDGTAAFVARVPQVPARLERVNLQTGSSHLHTRARSARSRWSERDRSDQHHRRWARIRVFLHSRRRDRYVVHDTGLTR